MEIAMRLATIIKVFAIHLVKNKGLTPAHFYFSGQKCSRPASKFLPVTNPVGPKLGEHLGSIFQASLRTSTSGFGLLLLIVESRSDQESDKMKYVHQNQGDQGPHMRDKQRPSPP